MSALQTGGSVGERDKSWQLNSGSRWVLPDQAAGHRYFITDQAVLLMCVSSHPCTLLRGRRGRPQSQMQISGHGESNSAKGQNLHCLSCTGGCMACARMVNAEPASAGFCSTMSVLITATFSINCHFVFFSKRIQILGHCCCIFVKTWNIFGGPARPQMKL